MKACTLFLPVLLAASVATATLAQAQAFPPPPPPCGECGPDRDGGPDLRPGPGMHGRGLALTEAQDDKLFALHHAAEPARRARQKELRHAQEALRAMGERGAFDEAKAAALAQSLGQAIAAEALEHAREQAQFLAMLTPAQRASMQERRGDKPGARP